MDLELLLDGGLDLLEERDEINGTVVLLVEMALAFSAPARADLRGGGTPYGTLMHRDRPDVRFRRSMPSDHFSIG